MSDSIESLLNEERTFSPSSLFSSVANTNDVGMYDEAYHDPLAWWDKWAKTLDWIEPWHTICHFESPNAQWFLGGKLNVSYNCVDRHALEP